MATLNIEGRKVTVDDSFLKLSPGEQNATVEEIAASFKPAETPTAKAANYGIPDSIRNLVPAAISDIPSEVGKATGAALQRATGDSVSDLPGYDPRTRGQLGPIEGLLRTGKQIAAIPETLLAPAIGVAQSLIGHPLAAVEDYGRKLNGMPADPEGSYERGKRDTDLALSAARPVGVPTVVGAPVAQAGRLKINQWENQIPAVSGDGPQVVAAAERLSETGSPVQVPKAIATDSMATQRAASIARNIPFAGDPLVSAAERTITQLGTKADEVAKGYGSGQVVTSGDAARMSIKDYITGESAATSKKFYDRVDALVDPAVTTDLSTTRRAAQAILDRRANAAISEQSGAVKRIEEAVTKPGGLNYDGIKDLRGYVRELKDNPSLLPSDISGKELNSIYDGLTADLKASVSNAGGPEASVAFERANKHYSLLSDRREALAKIIGTDGGAPAETVFERMVAMASSGQRADIARLAQARKAMGADDWNEFSSGLVGRMGRDTANFSGPEKLVGEGFSPQRFLSAYGKLSDAGKTMLFRSGGKGDLAQHLDDIARVSTRFKELQKFANPSGTGHAVLGGGMVAGLMTEPVTTVATVAGGRAVAYALSRPASAASMAKYAKAQQALALKPSASTVAAFTMASRNLIQNLGEFGRGMTPEMFMKGLQSPVPVRADEQQDGVPREPD